MGGKSPKTPSLNTQTTFSSQNDIFNELEPPSKPEDASQSSSASSIQPGQKTPSLPVSWATQTQKKSPEDYARDRAKYEQYFQGNRILPIPELITIVENKTLSFIVTDIKTRRLAGIRKETFKELLRVAGIPAKYFCRRSFATWDVLLPLEELAVKLASSTITSKHFWLQPEYMGRRRVKVTVCNVPIQLSADVIAAYLTEYGNVENVIKAKSTSGTAYGDHVPKQDGVPIDSTYNWVRKPNDDGGCWG